MKRKTRNAIVRSGFDLLEEFVSQPSVSEQNPTPVPPAIRQMQEKVYNSLKVAASWIRVIDTNTYPVVLARITASEEADAKPTLCLYNMADTRPVGDPSKWSMNPYGCQVAKGEDGIDRMYGRGIHNSKSGLAGMIDVIRAMDSCRELPVNIICVVDAEEEVRPNSLREVVTKTPSLFGKCQAAFMPLFCEGFGCSWLACKGVVVARVRIKSSRPQVHSGMESVLRWPDIHTDATQFVQAIQMASEAQTGLFDEIKFKPTTEEIRPVLE